MIRTTPSDLERESERLAALRRLEILDTPPEERFDRITRLACRSMNTRIALVSLVDGERQWFKSAQGMSESETTREISFCSHAILADGPFVVRDACEDERFSDNPLVTGAPGIRFYAGQPLRSADGHRLGTLCVIDSSPRDPSVEDIEVLQDLAALAENELHAETLNAAEKELRRRLEEAERRASIDALTRVWNRSVILQVVESEVQRAAREKIPLTAVMVDLDHFKSINDDHGHPSGDIVLAKVADRIRSALRTYDSVGRYGGDEFLCVLTHCDHEEADRVMERMRRKVRRRPLGVPGSPALSATVSLGACCLPAGTEAPSTSRLIEIADQALYRAKNSGRDKVILESYSEPPDPRADGVAGE